MSRIPQAAWNRFEQLEREQRDSERLINQIGTSIPKLFSQADTFIMNPSAVGTGTIMKMIDTDDAVSASVQFKILMVLTRIGDYHHDKPEITKAVNKMLKRLKGPTWAETKEASLSAKGIGFSVSELDWTMDENLLRCPRRIVTYHPNTIAFEVDPSGQITEDGILQYVLQLNQFQNPNWRLNGIPYFANVRNPFTTPTDIPFPYRMPFINQYGLVRIPRAKCLHMTNLPAFAFGSPYGKTEVRTAHLAWGLKQFVMRQLGVAAKRSANGFIWGTAPKGVPKVKTNLPVHKHNGGVRNIQRELSPSEALREMLTQREGDDAVVTHPETDGYKLTSMTMNGNMDQMLNVVNNCDVKIFRCFVLPSLVMTDGSAGSRSLGDKHFQIVGLVADSEAEKAAECWVNDIVTPFIEANFGEQEDYGYFVKRPPSLEERERLGNIFSTMSTTGFIEPHVQEDFSFVRKSVGLPERKQESFELDPNAGKQPPGEKDDEPDPRDPAEGDDD